MTEHPKLHFATYLSSRPVLIDYAARLLGSRDAAEDVVQEAYVRIVQARSGERPPLNPRGYLFRVVRNLAFNILKRGEYERRQLREEVPDWGLPASVPLPEESLEFRRSLRRLSGIVADLPQNQRVALEMHRLGGWSIVEIAMHLDVSERTAYRLVQTALARISLELKQESGTGEGQSGK